MLTETSPQVSDAVPPRGAGMSGNYRRTYANMRALDCALARSDLPAARQAFARLQADAPFIATALSGDPVEKRTRPLKALKVLGHCLLKGKLTGARLAFELFH